jgi:hypothetical protein
MVRRSLLAICRLSLPASSALAENGPVIEMTFWAVIQFFDEQQIAIRTNRFEVNL